MTIVIMALKLDEREFENIARVSPPPFVLVRQTSVATIATDLDAALERGSNA